MKGAHFMIQSRPVSDLRNKFTDIVNMVKEGQPVYLTKNGHGTMVVMSIETYSKMTEDIKLSLDVADKQSETNPTRYSHDEVFTKIRNKING